MATAIETDPTNNSAIDGILFGTRWTTTALTYSFATLPSQLSDYSPVNAINPDDFSALDSTQQLYVERALEMWTTVSGLTFTEAASPEDADIRVYWYRSPDNPTARVVDFPSSEPEGGDIQLGHSVANEASWDPGTYAYLTILHEIGHALGLKHPHDEIGIFPEVDPAADSIELSVMSYRSYPGQVLGGGYTLAEGSYPTAPMLHDIAALQYLYGPNWSYKSDDTTYTFDPSADVLFDTLWDGGGNDTYNFENYATNLTINLLPGQWSDVGRQYALLDSFEEIYARGNIANAYLYQNDQRSLIENARGGSGHDTLIGNQAANHLSGNAGNDTLSGGAGADTLEGGAGFNWASYANATAGVNASLIASAGNTGEASGDVYASIQGLQGSAYGDTLTGDTGGNGLQGLGGNDTLYGGDGNDRISGDAGNDYVSGGWGNDRILGGSGSDRLYGYTGSDTLDGELGNDLMSGSSGNDTVRGGSGNDSVDGGSGNDWVYGDTGADQVNGSSGNDRLIGGSGNDALHGSTGRDAFVFDSALGTARTNRKINFDTIKDFNVADDSLWLDNAIFSKLGKTGSLSKPAQLNKAFFTVGEHAEDRNDYLIYNKRTGILSYDADGSSAGKAVEIALLKKGIALSYKDFFVV